MEDKAYYESLAVFTGNDSVGGQIGGVKASKGVKLGNVYLGFVVGAYEQDDNKFDKVGLIPFQIAKAGSTGIVPIIGGEVNYKIGLYRDMFMKINNIITPVLTNTTLSLGFSY